MASVITSEAEINSADPKNQNQEQEYGLSTEVLRTLIRKHGFERQAGKPAEKMSRYTMMNLLVLKAAEGGLVPSANGNGRAPSKAEVEALVGRLVNEKLKDVAPPAPRTVVIQQPDTDQVTKVCGTMHQALPDVLRLVCAGVPVLLVGPAGSGKTYLAGQVARALDLPFSFNSLSAGCTESHVIGRVLPDETGNWTYRPSPFVKAYRDGGVHLFDEMDAADPNLLVLINAALANGHLSVPFADLPPIEKHPRAIVMAAANTFGYGADVQYVGRNQLDAATLDRFSVSTALVDYDQTMERTLTLGILGADQAEPLLDWAWELRKAIREHRLRRIMSTRTILNSARLLSVGESLETVRDRYFTSWSDDERRLAS